ncbi:dessication-induced 1VOC superfamily protein [Prunus dulcis]|uniref:Dessication-induced 1VOC superfamily protein n=1 Tax=Prunus dulcis TaxID=3755 RepID=A0A4Y1RMB4_PRUDU|nr:dessication-induced 1VOC superfamily protein [Prunus dulcis]
MNTDVAKSTAFYSKAFGYNIRRIDDSNRWGELESGQTTIAFTPVHQRETDDLTGVVKTPSSGRERQPVEVCFAYPDVDAAYKFGTMWFLTRNFVRHRAVENGAVAVSEPEEKEWGQKVGYVRDPDGIVVRLGSYVNPPTAK